MLRLACSFLLLATPSVLADDRPNIIYVLADDFGWQQADWHHAEGNRDPLATPVMSKLIEEGIELDQHYAFKFCAPTRSAIQSGRNPIHVNVQNYGPAIWNYQLPEVGQDANAQGIPRSMTTMGRVMTNANYSTHFFGKWDVGMATWDVTPKGRGYDTSLFYYHHDNDYWTSKVQAADGRGHEYCPGVEEDPKNHLVDLFLENEQYQGPALGLNNSYQLCNLNGNAEAGLPYPVDAHGMPQSAANCRYEDDLFHKFVQDRIAGHNPEVQPLFIFWSAHVIHTPLQVPAEFYAKYHDQLYDDLHNLRAKYLAMVNYLDTKMGETVELLKQKKMYDNTFIVFTSDNGGPVYFGGHSGANNFPLRGGKTSNWQGGIRVNAFVSGGVIPKAMRGKKLAGLGAVWDWYATFAELAGVDPEDKLAAEKDLPKVDSISLWPYLSGQKKKSPRRKLAIGSSSCVPDDDNNPVDDFECVNVLAWGDTQTLVMGLIKDYGKKGLWKVLLGYTGQTGWQGPIYPNATDTKTKEDGIECHFPWWGAKWTWDCGRTGCLFRLDTDPTEHHDLLVETPDDPQVKKIHKDMMRIIKREGKNVFSPNRGPGEKDPLTMVKPCDEAINRWSGFYGPYLELEPRNQAKSAKSEL